MIDKWSEVGIIFGTHLEVKPLAVPVGVEVGPQVQLVVRLADADGFAQVSRLKTGFETVGRNKIGRNNSLICSFTEN